MLLWKICLLALVTRTSCFNILCYYTNSAQNRPSKGKFFPENIDPKLCTHILFAYCRIMGMMITTSQNNDIEMYAKIIALKHVNPRLKVLLVGGGSSAGHFPFLKASLDYTNRNMFAKNVATYLRQHHFDGFQLDWQYPHSGEKEKYFLLVKTLRIIFEEEAKASGKTCLLLGIAASPEKPVIDTGMDVQAVTQYVDLFNIHTFDYYGEWSDSIGFNSPLYAHPNEEGEDRFLNMNWSAQYMVSREAPKEKIHLGIAAYGRSFTLEDPDIYHVLSQYSDAGDSLTYSDIDGIAFYYEICEIIKSGGKVVRVGSQGNPYVVDGDQWFGYDDVESVTKKAQYVKDNYFAGVILYTLDMDDFNGTFCNLGKYPLLSALKANLPEGDYNEEPEIIDKSEAIFNFQDVAVVCLLLLMTVGLMWLIFVQVRG